jgi:hypothetical protein
VKYVVKTLMFLMAENRYAQPGEVLDLRDTLATQRLLEIKAIEPVQKRKKHTNRAEQPAGVQSQIPDQN